jgi:hypothetical protein
MSAAWYAPILGSCSTFRSYAGSGGWVCTRCSAESRAGRTAFRPPADERAPDKPERVTSRLVREGPRATAARQGAAAAALRDGTAAAKPARKSQARRVAKLGRVELRVASAAVAAARQTAVTAAWRAPPVRRSRRC